MIHLVLLIFATFFSLLFSSFITFSAYPITRWRSALDEVLLTAFIMLPFVLLLSYGFLIFLNWVDAL